MKWSFRIMLLVTLLLASCGNPTESKQSIFGSVVDSDGLPIEGINIAVIQKENRVDAYSAADGSFSAELPTSTDPNWNVEIVGINCTSKVMTNCVLTGYFESFQNTDVTVPLSKPVTFVFEKATTSIKGKAPVSGLRIFAIRSDGANSWGESLNDGAFELPASDGKWDVYAIDLNSNQESEHVSLEINNGISDSVNLTFP
ncbi:MAG: carboxypeptidase-like regulatory domain-containing protein [Anaerolineales bacterium]